MEYKQTYARCLYDSLIIMFEGAPFRGVYVSGGYVRDTFANEEPKDIDFSFLDASLLVAFRDYLLFKRSGYYIHRHSKTAVTLKHRNSDTVIQLLKVRYGKPKVHLDDFDFIACKGLIDLETGILHYHPDFFRDIGQRILRYDCNKQNAMPSIYRAVKFRERGWKTSVKELKNMVRQADPDDNSLYYD